MTQLYVLTQSYNQLLEMLEEGENEAITNTLEAIQEDIEDKAENIAKIIRTLDADVNVLKEEEKRMADRRRSLENKRDYLKEYLQQQLEFAGLQKIKRPTLTVAIQNNPPSVEVLDETLIPSHYMIPQPSKVDKKSILSLLKDGQNIPGVEMKQSRSVRIR